MEFLISSISIFFLLSLISFPFTFIYFLKKWNVKHPFLTNLIIGTLTTIILTVSFAWWTDTSTQILLSHYGYYFDFMNSSEKYINVSEENIERVKNLEISFMGIGWPLKAIFAYFLYFPYLMIIYFFKKKKQRLH